MAEGRPLRLWVFPDLSTRPRSMSRFRVSVTDTGLLPVYRAISFLVGVGQEVDCLEDPKSRRELFFESIFRSNSNRRSVKYQGNSGNF